MPSEDSSSECPRNNRGHCFEHGSKCCHCGAESPWRLQLAGAAMVPRPEEPGEAPCEHPNRRDAGSLYDGPGGRKTWLYYYCPDCEKQFREEDSPKDAPCEHGGGDMQDCPHGCAASAESGALCACGCPRYAHMGKPRGCMKHGFHEFTDPELMVEVLTATPEQVAKVDAKFAAAEAEHLEPPCVCGHIEPEHEAGLKPPYTGCNQCSDCSAYRTQPERRPCGRLASLAGPCSAGDWCCMGLGTPDAPAPPQPERRPPYAVAYAVQGHLYEVALPGDATVEAVDGALVIRHSLGQVAGIVAVNPMSTKERES